VFALADCNGFHAGCHRIFRPDLRGRPVVVPSGNDGFVIARSKQARAPVPDLQPFFRIRPVLQQHDVAVFSSSYPLYGNISGRMMVTLQRFSPETEAYSIDGTFLSLAGMRTDRHRHGTDIRETIWKEVRLPVSVGIAPTRTLAKIANRVAKQDPALNETCTLGTADQWLPALERIPVAGIWGINRSTAKHLAAIGITNAREPARANARSSGGAPAYAWNAPSRS